MDDSAIRPEQMNEKVSPLLINLSFLSKKPTGISVYAQNLLPALRSLHPTALIPSDYGFDASVQTPTIPVPSGMTPDEGRNGHGRRLVWTQRTLPKLYRQTQSRLLFSPIPEAPLWTKTRSVVMAHDVIPLRFPRRWSPLTNYFRYYVPRVLHQAEHIICNSQATADDLMRFYNIRAEKITPILLAYDATHFRWLDLPTRPYFLYLGRIEPYKNVSRAIAAFAQLPADYEFWIAGPQDDRYTPTLMQQIQELHLGDRVKFLDYVPYEALPIVINQAIALLSISLCEGFGLPALEAMACGTPVIASQTTSLPEVVGEAGLLVDPLSLEAITDAMQQVAQSTTIRSHLRYTGLQRAQKFSWQTTGQQTSDVLQTYL